jgi:hypothetical protein
MHTETYQKDPDEKKDYGFTWAGTADTILGTGDTVASSVWVLPVGITQSSPAPSNDANTTTIWLSGGTHNQDYTLINRITSTNGRILEAALVIQVRNRV